VVPSYDGLAAAPSGNVLGLITYDVANKAIWFYEASSNKLTMLNPATGSISEYPLLAFTSNPGIEQIVAGPDGNIYLTEPSLNEIGLFDIKTDLLSRSRRQRLPRAPASDSSSPPRTSTATSM
jgi:streptogramin lyase